MQNKSFYWMVGVVVIFVAIVGSAAYYKNSSSNGESIPGPEIVSTDWTKGNGKVVLLEYSDFQCPACKAYHSIINQVINDEINSITFVYRHFPLPQHGNSFSASRAAEAAGRQGKFFEMYDLIFINQDNWASAKDPKTIFEGYAQNLGLDMAKFTTDYDSKEIRARIQNDYKAGLKMGVQATPTFYINGQKIVNPQSVEEFKKIIEIAASSTVQTQNVNLSPNSLR